MTKNIFIFTCLFAGLLPFITVAKAQVGINTSMPYVNSVFHIDAKGNNTSATSVSADEAADDIVIDKKGNVGVGTVNPTTKLHIDATRGSLKAIRIADGSEGASKYLFSDDEGRVSWKPKPIPQGVVYYSNTRQVMTNNVFTKLPVEINDFNKPDISIPYEGNYILTLRWWGSTNLTNDPTVFTITNAQLELRRTRAGVTTVIDNTVMHTPVQNSGNYSRFTFTISLFAQSLYKDDILTLYIKPIGSSSWETGGGLSSAQQSQVIYYPSVMVYNI